MSPNRNATCTEAFEFSVTTQVGVLPVQAPVQLATAKPVAGATDNVILVPDRKFAEQVAGQLIPDGLLITVPWPAGTVTVSCFCGRALKVAVTAVLPYKLT
jgi:hypothetical protein